MTPVFLLLSLPTGAATTSALSAQTPPPGVEALARRASPSAEAGGGQGANASVNGQHATKDTGQTGEKRTLDPRPNEALFVAVATRLGFAVLHKDEEPPDRPKPPPPRSKLVGSGLVPDADVEAGLTERAVDFAIYGGLSGGAENGALGSIGLRFEWAWLELGDSCRIFAGVRAGRFGLFQQQDQDLSGYEASLEAGARLWRPEHVRVFLAFSPRWMAYDRDASGLSMLNERGAVIGAGVRFQVSEQLNWEGYPNPPEQAPASRSTPAATPPPSAPSAPAPTAQTAAARAGATPPSIRIPSSDDAVVGKASASVPAQNAEPVTPDHPSAASTTGSPTPEKAQSRAAEPKSGPGTP